jgi:hypothetical protein
MMRIRLQIGYISVLILAHASARAADDSSSYSCGDVLVSHEAEREGLYYDTPANRVAYNVQIVKIAEAGSPRYVTVFHCEPRNKGLGKPGDSIRIGWSEGLFSYKMPAECAYRLWGVQDDSQNLLFSADAFGVEGWGGTGNPMMVKGLPGDDYYYIFFLAVGDDDSDRNVQEDDYRHILLQARTRDFIHVDLRADIDGAACWKPFDDVAPKQWRRPKPVIDVDGKRVCNRIGRKQGTTQGLIGSICMANGVYHFFYTEIDQDNKTYLFHRECSNPATLDNTWSRAERVSDEALMEGTVIRVAKTPGTDRWIALYNGYVDPDHNNRLRQSLFLQVTRNLTVIGDGGLSSLKFFARSIPGYGIGDSCSLHLASGNGVFAQHDFLTDPYGNATSPSGTSTGSNSPAAASGLVTWTAMDPAVYGSKVYWAEFTLRENAGGR